MEPKSEPKSNEEKKTWTAPVVEDYDLLSTTGGASPQPPGMWDGDGYS